MSVSAVDKLRGQIDGNERKLLAFRSEVLSGGLKLLEFVRDAYEVPGRKSGTTNQSGDSVSVVWEYDRYIPSNAQIRMMIKVTVELNPISDHTRINVFAYWPAYDRRGYVEESPYRIEVPTAQWELHMVEAVRVILAKMWDDEAIKKKVK